jgi:hypothetical protein
MGNIKELNKEKRISEVIEVGARKRDIEIEDGADFGDKLTVRKRTEGRDGTDEIQCLQEVIE